MSSQLPARPNLEHLKAQATDLLADLRNGRQLPRAHGLLATEEIFKLSHAQLIVAREYGFESWAKLKRHVCLLYEVGRLKEAIDREEFEVVKALLTANPALHRAPLGYADNGPLTWVAECRVPWGQVNPARLEMAQWMIENGSDIHQGGDGPLMRASLMGYRIPMVELLVLHGADVKAEWSGFYPIIFAPCETLEPAPLQWLLEHGADPNQVSSDRNHPGTALDQVIAGYLRSANLPVCIDILLERGGTTRFGPPAVFDILRGHTESLAERLDNDPALVNKKFPDLDFGETGSRRLRLRGGTLLHVAAEFGNAEAAALLISRGADVNAKANGGSQTPIFHAVSQFRDWGLPVVKLLLDEGADLTIRATLPGHYERPDEFVECTPYEYASLFPGEETETLALLRIRRAEA